MTYQVYFAYKFTNMIEHMWDTERKGRDIMLLWDVAWRSRTWGSPCQWLGEAERKEWVAPVSQSGKEKIAETLSFLFRLFSLTHCQFFGKKERKLNHENYSMIRKWRRGSLLMNCPVEMPRHISETWDMELRRFWVQAGAQVKMWPGSNNKRKCGSGNKHQHHFWHCGYRREKHTL